MPFLDCHSYLSILLKSALDSDSNDQVKNLIKIVAQNFINFMRNCFAQTLDAFKSLKFKTFLTILKWKFELELYFLVKNNSAASTKGIPFVDDDFFEPSRVKEKLLNQAKIDLSCEVNRSNLILWREYALLKLMVNNGQVKETRKILDTLLKTSDSSHMSTEQACTDVYSLSIDYV